MGKFLYTFNPNSCVQAYNILLRPTQLLMMNAMFRKMSNSILQNLTRNYSQAPTFTVNGFHFLSTFNFWMYFKTVFTLFSLLDLLFLFCFFFGSFFKVHLFKAMKKPYKRQLKKMAKRPTGIEDHLSTCEKALRLLLQVALAK